MVIAECFGELLVKVVACLEGVEQYFIGDGLSLCDFEGVVGCQFKGRLPFHKL